MRILRGAFARKGAWALVGAMALTASVADSRAADSSDASIRTAAIPTAAVAREAVQLPQVLSDKDAKLYERIFEVQDGGDWKTADKLIAKLEDKVLMGHVLYQRYMHPTAYRSRYAELKDWMAEYGDHPGAERVYKLALSRRPAKHRNPQAPVAGERAAYVPDNGLWVQGRKGLSAAERREVAATKRRIAHLIRRNAVTAAKKLIESPRVKSLFSQAELDEARAKLARGYYSHGRDEDALDKAEKAASQSGGRVPEAHWLAGLASWRMQKYDDAAGHFEAAAVAAKKSAWLGSAAAFWAARTHLINRRPEQVNRWLETAAEHPRTFYGMLAMRMLGKPIAFDWSTPKVESDALAKLGAVPAGRRAVALLQAGQPPLAERELRRLAGRVDSETARGILVLAANADMPGLAVRLDRYLFPDGGGYDGAAFPIPSWEPEGGFRVDRALVYALIRQESAFNPAAKSWAGASGLMQLMPRTAGFVAQDRSYHRGQNRKKLFSPEVNLTLGQKYLEMLIDDGNIQGDLFFIAAAWNGGPGNLAKWWKKTNHNNDPLLFIESIPSRETRIFVERVLTYLWIYRNRLGQPSPSLDMIASGEWPVYIAQGQEPTMVAEGVDNNN